VAIERGDSDRFLVGNVGSQRDFIDVRDCVAALVLVSEKAEAGASYNLCNGRCASLQDVITLLQGLARKPFEPSVDPARLRAADDSRIVGDPARIRALGYAPRLSLVETVQASLEYRRSMAEGGRGRCSAPPR